MTNLVVVMFRDSVVITVVSSPGAGVVSGSS